MKRLLFALLLSFIAFSPLFGIWDTGAHDAGLLWLKITNYGMFGYENAAIWPKGSGEFYIFGAGVWVGALQKIQGMEAQLSADISDTSTEILVNSTEGFQSPGVLKIGDEWIHYSDLTDSSFIGCIRGFAASTPESHSTGELVEEYLARMSVGYNPSSATSEFVPGDLPNEPGYTDSTDRILFSDDPEDTTLWPLRDSLGNPIVISTQDSYSMMNDEDSSHCSAPQNIKVVQIGYSWSYHLYEDFLFLTYLVINAGDEPLSHCYLGLCCDADIGNYTDDLVGFDAERNLGYAFDSDFSESGWEHTPGYIGFDFLESPLDTSGEQLGLTAFRIIRNPGVPGPGLPDPGTDDEAYQLAAGYNFQTGEYQPFDSISEPTDVRFVQFTGPFDLAPGETARVVIAVIAGADLTDLDANSDLAQSLYDMHFVTHWAHVLSPNGSEEVSGLVNIQWEDSSAFGTSLRADISISRDNGETWTELAHDIEDVGSYQWSTEDFPDGTRYRVRVTVYDTLAVGEDVSDTTFTVNNPGNGVPDLIYLSPKKGTLRGDVDVTWWADDADHDTLVISLYAKKLGEDWKVLAENLPNTGSFSFDSKFLVNGSYRLKLRAADRDTFVEDSSGVVKILNDHEVTGDVVHEKGGCNTLSILPLLYYPDSALNHVMEIKFHRIQRSGSADPLYTCEIYDATADSILYENFPLSTKLDGLLYKDFTDPIGEWVLEFDSQIDGEGFTYTEFRELVNVSGFDGHLELSNPDSFGVSHPIPGLRWAFRGSDYEIYWVKDDLDTTCVTMKVRDITNEVWVPYDSVPGDNWFLGNFGDYDRCLDPTRHKQFYLCGGVFYFNRDGSMNVPPGDGDVWLIRSSGPRVPCDGNVYKIYPTHVREEKGKVAAFWMSVPRPNPARGKIEVLFSIPERTRVRLYLYDVAGRKVRDIIDGEVDAGIHRIHVEARDNRGNALPSGVYFLRLDLEGNCQVKKVLFVR